MSRRTSQAFFIVKLAMGISLLIILLLWNDNWQEVLRVVRESEIVWIAPFLGISILLMWISCLKWGMFLRVQPTQVSQARLFSLYLIGRFFNNFFPSSVGGDVVRSYMLGRQIDSQGRAMASVFLERLTGFVAMVTLATGAFICSPTLRREPLILISILIMGEGCLAVLLVIWKPALVSWVARPVRHMRLIKRFEEKAARFHGYLLQFKGRMRLITKAMLISYLFYACAAVNVYLGAKLLGVECGFVQLLIITPIIMLIASLPLTPNGIGVWEWCFSVFLVSAGATAQEGLAIALAVRGKEWLISVVGGLLFMLERSHHVTGERRAWEAMLRGRNSSIDADL